MTCRSLLSVLAPLLSASCLLLAQTPTLLSPDLKSPWELEQSNVTASFRGVHAVGNGVAWVSGTHGTILRTEDGGYLWQSCVVPPDAEKLDFRGIWAWDADTAIVLSSGEDDQSRIYKTTDGCHSWTLMARNTEKDGFWDAIRFWDREHGAILGDPVNHRFVLATTSDGGKTWDFHSMQGPVIEPKTQAAFAASNSSLAFGNSARELKFVTGGTGGSKLYAASSSPGQTWQTFPIPVMSGNESAGVFSLDLKKDGHGVAVGGDYRKPDAQEQTAAWTSDGGKHWLAADQTPHGYRSSVAWSEEWKAWIAVGTNGTDVSYDGGRTWQALDHANWNALSLPWVVGPNGRIGKLVSLKRKSATK